jgi:PleD family two-component response regulator
LKEALRVMPADSIGVSRKELVAEVVRRADEALYRAKQEGRNRVARSA